MKYGAKENALVMDLEIIEVLKTGSGGLGLRGFSHVFSCC